MRLSYIFLVAAVMVASTLETTSAASGVTLSTSNTVLANANGNTGHDQRFLRQRQIPDDEEEEDDDTDDDTDDDVDSQEERGYMEAAGLLKRLWSTGGNWDDMMSQFTKVTDYSTFETILPKFQSMIEKKFPNFNLGMSDDAFERQPRKILLLLWKIHTAIVFHATWRLRNDIHFKETEAQEPSKQSITSSFGRHCQFVYRHCKEFGVNGEALILTLQSLGYNAPTAINLPPPQRRIWIPRL